MGIVKTLAKNGAVLAALYLCFNFGGFSARQSTFLTLLGWFVFTFGTACRELGLLELSERLDGKVEKLKHDIEELRETFDELKPEERSSAVARRNGNKDSTK
jgi:hypothetical protein